ncbi:EF-hand domain-containing protein [Limnoglobus roseus]|uniref:EF-hand domain-containing protein n=1 Tax=Limnoglobus roseus TaxID=2598579 RepID=A0A5C1AR72_9BACT|nr:EF-hand domain-containing protein [Limnoglobus roseus]QEL20553.1 EF-hand domain-containing protein [Limnoglobus roseus]
MVSKDELKALLADAGIGSGLTRWAWANGIIEAVDANRDGVIDWAEFEAVFRAAGG